MRNHREDRRTFAIENNDRRSIKRRFYLVSLAFLRSCFHLCKKAAFKKLVGGTAILQDEMDLRSAK